MDALFIGYISIIHSNQKLIRDDFLGCVFEWFLLLLWHGCVYCFASQSIIG